MRMHSSWSSFHCQCQCSPCFTSCHSPLQRQQQQQQLAKCGNRTSGRTINKSITRHGQVNSSTLYCVTVILVIVSSLMTTASTGSLSNPIGPGRKCPQCGECVSLGYFVNVYVHVLCVHVVYLAFCSCVPIVSRLINLSCVLLCCNLQHCVQ